MIIGGKGGKRRRVGGASCGASDETAAKNERTVDPYGQAMVIYGGRGVGSRHFAYRSTKSRPGHYPMANEKATMIHALRAKNWPDN